ncbi:MAG: acyltransferase family protein [Actinomycetales bacterium]|nr:acyltransferase family protein [Actinomycetales bacterium]
MTRRAAVDAPVASSTPPTAGAAKPRIALWDNLRFLAIVLVVMGHTLQPQAFDDDVALTIYLVIYSFHVPLFLFLAGYFSRGEAPDGSRMRRVVTDLLVPYVLLQGIWSVIQLLVEGRLGFNWTTAHWTLWFLIALAAYRILLPYLALLKRPIALGGAVVLALAAGFWTNVDSTLALTRVIGFLPFFLLGWMLRDSPLPARWLEAPPRVVWPVRAGALAVFATWITIVAVNIRAFDRFELRLWLFADDSYRNMDAVAWWAPLLRLGLMALTLALITCAVLLAPRRPTFFTSLGAATLYVYLLHTFVLYPIRQSEFLRGDHAHGWWILGGMAFAILVAFALSSKPVRWATRWAIEPRASWLFRRTEPVGR